nr:MAG TPA: collagen alpha 1(VIII) chain protein [Caudoviricetes sp.]
MIIEKASVFSEINLGRQGENHARKVVFDVLRAWRDEFGSAGAAGLIAQREEDAEPYPVALEEENGMLVWTVSASDTAYAGEGKAELRYTVGNTVVKSCVYKTVVRASLGDSTSDPPEAYQSWVDEVLTAAAGVETAVNKMPYIDSATGNWFKWDAKTNAFADTGIAATGPQGDTGATGPAGADGNRLYATASEPTTANKGDYWINTSTYNISQAMYRRQSDGSYTLYWVKLGNIKGATGATGPAGADGEDGVTPHIGDNGNWFLGDTDTGIAATGATGPQGPAGTDGHTPVKGMDYWTAADQTEIVNDVLAALPTWTGGSY